MKTKRVLLQEVDKGILVKPAECGLFGETHPDCWVRRITGHPTCEECPRHMSGVGLRADPWGIYPLSEPYPTGGETYYLVLPEGGLDEVRRPFLVERPSTEEEGIKILCAVEVARHV